MPRKRSVIAAAPMVDIIKQAGGERVSEEAAKALADYLFQKGLNISKDAVKFCGHAGRKTVKKEDVDLATRGA